MNKKLRGKTEQHKLIKTGLTKVVMEYLSMRPDYALYLGSFLFNTNSMTQQST